LFIEIAKEIISRKPHTRFLWIGGTMDKKFEKECLDKTKSNSLENEIIWLGDVGEDYFNYLNCADGFVLTSVKESFSMVTVEALLLGLPIVTQNCGGVIEILRADIGAIVEEKNNPVLMANEMIKFMDGTYKVDKPKQIERAKEFDSAKTGKHWDDILERYFNRI
jgi:glycosyltransferase involved in cell wall biosynthesis